ncbi:hypothetical protein MUO79_11640 [Candidatus Bathyarchaeota archaeon]|nr:hypothetical protein [Candidatus Bathyarchaeota archaeon]
MTRHPLNMRFYCTRPAGPCDKPCKTPPNINKRSLPYLCPFLEVVNEVAMAKGS